MKNFTRVVCVLLALALCLSFAACKKKGATDLGDDQIEALDASDIANEGVGGETTATQKEKVVKNADDMTWSQLVSNMPADLRGSIVTVYSWNPIKDVSGAEDVIANFTKQTGIKVNWIQGSYEDYDTEILAKIKAGDSPDVIRYNHPTPVRMSLCQDIKTATGSDCKGAIWDSVLTSVYSVKGKTYAVNLKNTFNQQPSAVAYTMSNINRYKLEDPYVLWKSGKWTYNKFIEICRDYYDKSGNCGWMTSAQLDLIWFSGLRMIEFDGSTYKNNVNTSAYITAVQRCCDNHKNNITPEATRETSKFENGTYLFYTTTMLSARRTDSHFTTLKKNNDLYYVPFPTGANSTFYQNYQEYEAYGVPKGAKNGIGAYYFMRYYLNKDNYDESTFFVNNQALEAYNWCRSQQNVNYQCDRALTASVGNSNATLETWLRTTHEAAQAQTQISSKASPIVDRAVAEGNKIIANF